MYDRVEVSPLLRRPPQCRKLPHRPPNAETSPTRQCGAVLRYPHTKLARAVATQPGEGSYTKQVGFFRLASRRCQERLVV